LYLYTYVYVHIYLLARLWWNICTNWL